MKEESFILKTQKIEEKKKIICEVESLTELVQDENTITKVVNIVMILFIESHIYYGLSKIH